jgi:hypothetical protein
MLDTPPSVNPSFAQGVAAGLTIAAMLVSWT